MSSKSKDLDKYYHPDNWEGLAEDRSLPGRYREIYVKVQKQLRKFYNNRNDND